MSFTMIDRPLLKMIFWDQESFTAMRDAAEEAVRERRSKFTVDLGRKYRRVEFDTAYAVGVIPQLAAAFAANPMPVFPENREGEEP